MTKSSPKRIEKKLLKRKSPPRSRLVPGTPTKSDHEQLIRVYAFFFGISGALEGNPDLLGRAKAISKGVLDELTERYQATYGEEATEELFGAIASEMNPTPPPPEEVKTDVKKPKEKRTRKPKAAKA